MSAMSACALLLLLTCLTCSFKNTDCATTAATKPEPPSGLHTRSFENADYAQTAAVEPEPSISLQTCSFENTASSQLFEVKLHFSVVGCQVAMMPICTSRLIRFITESNAV